MGNAGRLMMLVSAGIGGLGCAAHHEEAGAGHGPGLAGALEAGAVAGRARDEALAAALSFAEIAGTVSGRDRWLAEGTLATGDDGWHWSPSPADRLEVRAGRATLVIRCPRLALDPGRGTHGDHDVRCAIGGGGGAIEVGSWRGGGEAGGSARGAWQGAAGGTVAVHLVHVGTVAPGESFEAIEGTARADGGVEVRVRQTLRRTDAPWGEQLERWIEDRFEVDGTPHRIDGAALSFGAAGWTADGKAIGRETVARLVVEGGPRVVWRIGADPAARVVVAGAPD